MNTREYYNEHKQELLKVVYESGYTPSELVKDANSDGVSVYDYILILNGINF